MSDGRIATLSTLLFGRSGDALSHFVRIITNIIDLLNLMPNGYYQEHKTLVFEMTAVRGFRDSSLKLIYYAHISSA
jgi:hypothetical protein